MALKIKKMLDQNMEQRNLTKQIYKTNLFLKIGFKENIEDSFRKTCLLLKKHKKQNPLLQIKKAIELITPFCETKSIKMKNIVTNVPVEITKKRQQLLATRFLFIAIKEKKKSFLYNNLTLEVFEILNITGNSFKLCENFQKNVEINKIFIQYRY